jgi:hypothetical protein
MSDQSMQTFEPEKFSPRVTMSPDEIAYCPTGGKQDSSTEPPESFQTSKAYVKPALHPGQLSAIRNWNQSPVFDRPFNS